MVVSSQVIIIAFNLLGLAQYSLAKDEVLRLCGSDTTGCVMCTGSTLRSIWDAGVAKADSCDKMDLKNENFIELATCYCESFSRLSFSWTTGTCCSEYSPTLAAATNVCNLKSYPVNEDSFEKLKKAIAEGKDVQNMIWRDDSGVRVPKLSVHIKEYSGSPASRENVAPQDVSHYQSKALYVKAREKPEPERKSTEVESVDNVQDTRMISESKFQVTNTGSMTNLSAEPIKEPNHRLAEPKPEVAHKLHEPKTEVPHNLHEPHNGPEYKPHEQKKGSEYQPVTPPGTVHHHAKLNTDKCDKKDCKHSKYYESDKDKYRHARRSRHQGESSFAKRNHVVSLHPRVAHLRTALVKRNNAHCGLDFQGVQYPTEVAPSVKEMYAMF